MTTTTQPTKAEQNAERMAARLREIGWTVELRTEDREPQLYSDGSIMIDGRHVVGFTANGPMISQAIHGSWATKTTGRRTTRYITGGRWTAYSEMERLTQRQLWAAVSSAVDQARYGWLREWLTAQGIEPTRERMLDTRLMTACLQARAAARS
jgi:hypothetical protein